MNDQDKKLTEGMDEKLAAAFLRDNDLEDRGMHGDDRETCYAHRCWAAECEDRHTPSRF